MKFSLCIPMYNESSIIKDTAKTLSEYMQANFDDYEIIFSNDGSKDGCDKMVEELGLPYEEAKQLLLVHGEVQKAVNAYREANK